MVAKVYGIPNCGSVKKAIASLKAQEVDVVFHDFKKHGVDPQLVDQWIGAFGVNKVINRQGTTWRNLEDHYKTKADSPEGAKALLLEFPTIIKRPVVEFQGELTIGQTEFGEK